MISNKPSLRVLHIFSTLGVGGAETWLMALLRYHDLIKYDLPFNVRFDICLTSGSKGIFDAEAATLGANLFYLNFSRGNLITFSLNFRSILANGHYDVIHDHQDYISGLHFFCGIGLLPSVRISHIHNPLLHLNSYYTSYQRKITAKVGKYLVSQIATHVTGTSRQIIYEYGFNEDTSGHIKLSAVYCGFDTNLFKWGDKNCHEEVCTEFGWDNRRKIILFVGRLNSNLNQKNPGFALEVAKECIDTDRDITFLMVGDGKAEEIEFQKRVKLWGLEKSIRIIGQRSDIPRLMLGSNLLLFPSIGEGLGMVAVEAQAAGLRVLASDNVPRECEVIADMVVFKSLDATPLEWTKEVLRLLSLPRPDNIVCNKLVNNSPFSINNSAANLLNIYMGFD